MRFTFCLFNAAAPTEIYTLSLHDALPISRGRRCLRRGARSGGGRDRQHGAARDRKSTRLNSSHLGISYAVFCLKKKKKKSEITDRSYSRGTNGVVTKKQTPQVHDACECEN